MIFLKNANKGQYVVYMDLRETLCYLSNKNDFYLVVPNSKTKFITFNNIQYFMDN